MIEIHPDSHDDHTMTAEQRAAALALASEKLRADIEFFTAMGGPAVLEVELPEELETVPCDLWGPKMGDGSIPESEVFYAVRGSRPGPSRMTARSPRQVRTVTVIAGRHDGKPWVLFTMYGGPPAPREPWDSSLAGVQKKVAETFWAEHALATK